MTEHFTDREAFEAIIRTMLERGSQGSFGRIHLVSVLPDAEGAASLGAALPKALSIAEHIIQRRLSPEDACVPLEQGKYMLVFPGLTDTEGMIRPPPSRARSRSVCSASPPGISTSRSRSCRWTA